MFCDKILEVSRMVDLGIEFDLELFARGVNYE